jgi:hypothetical protein
MRVLALVILLLMFGKASSSEPSSAPFAPYTKIAQSYCAICGSDRTNCVVRCNGSGACIQNCDDDYRLCVERACRR